MLLERGGRARARVPKSARVVGVAATVGRNARETAAGKLILCGVPGRRRRRRRLHSLSAAAAAGVVEKKRAHENPTGDERFSAETPKPRSDLHLTTVPPIPVREVYTAAGARRRRRRLDLSKIRTKRENRFGER